MLYLCCGKLACGKSRWAEAFVKENPAVILSVDGLTIPLADLLAGPVHDRVTSAVKQKQPQGTACGKKDGHLRYNRFHGGDT